MQGRSASGGTRELPSLTPLRGIAALWVVLYHYTFQCFPSLNSAPYTHLVQKGYLAVDMFFLLSGFVLTHVYHEAFESVDGRNYWKFLNARIARLYPLHLLVLLLFVATAVASRLSEYRAAGTFEPLPLEGPRSFTALLANLFMLQGLQAGKLSWNYPAWSISVEFMAYLTFPFMLPVLWRANMVLKWAFAVALFGALCGLAYFTRDNFNQWDGPLTLWRCLPEFMLGTLLYSAFRNGRGAATLSRDSVAGGVCAAAVLLLHLGVADIAIVPLFALLILALVSNTGYFSVMLNTRPLIWLGTISYSLYVLHGLVQYLAPVVLQRWLGLQDIKALPVAPSFVLMVGMVAACLIAGTVTYYGVEITGRHYLRKLLGIWRPRKRNASSESGASQRRSGTAADRLPPSATQTIATGRS